MYLILKLDLDMVTMYLYSANDRHTVVYMWNAVPESASKSLLSPMEILKKQDRK